MEKFPAAAASPKAAPVLLSIAIAAVMVVSIENPWNERMNTDTSSTRQYVSMNAVIADTIGADTAVFPNLTATTERG